MALGDGTAWDEGNPQQTTLANTLDSHIKDDRKGTRLRMQAEHVWPASQTGAAEAGYHTYITLQAQTSMPNMPVVAAVTQAGMLFMTAGNLMLQNSAGGVVTIISSDGTINITNGQYSSTGTVGELIIGSPGGVVTILSPGISGQLLSATTGGQGVIWASNAALFGSILDYGSSASVSTPLTNSAAKIAHGSLSIGANSSAAITNLPFASASSYRVIVTYAASATNMTNDPGAVNNSGSQATLYNNDGSTRVLNWVAIGG